MKISKFLLLNQMAGPLFRELAEDLADAMPEGCILKTGHPDTLRLGSQTDKLRIQPAPAYNRKNKITRILSWLHYAVISLWSMLIADKSTALLIVSNPPLLGPLAWLVNCIRNTPYVVLVYDLHPDTMVSFGVLSEVSIVTRLWRKVNRSVWEKAAAVYTIGPVMAEKLAAQFDPLRTPLGKVGIVPPWADTQRIQPIPKLDNPLADELGQAGVITVLYSGNMGISHDIDSMLEAARLLRSRQDIKFLFIGEGAKWQDACEFRDKHQLNNLDVLPFQPEEKLPYTMALGDIALVALDKGAEGLMVPSKMYYYLAAGSAVIGICHGRNDVSETLNKADCGITITPGMPDELEKTISMLADDPERLCLLRKKARRAAVNTYSRAVCTGLFINSLPLEK
ncbi:glycosyltransferase family 4 protein [Endozoicomonas sp. ONNA2]|uniref:glycosyltransferase family 4 protein n=1 Tax=Endozoicomonas sp. ONNA2 TaxID=2828741 RepID=UPI0021495ECA|nr:glycosyltransferase family 4 protein [Endozoicomonas sp. ONNA2]